MLEKPFQNTLHQITKLDYLVSRVPICACDGTSVKMYILMQKCTTAGPLFFECVEVF